MCHTSFKENISTLLLSALFLSVLVPMNSFAQTTPSAELKVVSNDNGKLKTQACRHPSFSQEVQCGHIQRPLNPLDVNGKKIDIHFVILPSQDKNKLSDAVFLLAGGPGQSAIETAGFGDAILKKLNHRRDLVFVDQRGTGLSASLACKELEASSDILDRAATIKKIDECRQHLQTLTHGDLRFYSTSIAVQDLEAVRLALQYSPINLVGVSYGTRVGLEYLRQYPQSVRRLILDGVVPPDMRLPAADSQAAVNGVFEACLKNSVCNTTYPQLAETWKRLLAQYSGDKLKKVNVMHPRLAYAMEIPITKESILGFVNKALYSPVMASTLPYAITQAEQGQFAPLLTLAGAFGQQGPGGINMGMHFSVWCGEAYARPVVKNDQVKSEFEVLMQDLYDKVCEKWPRAQIPANFYQIPVSTAPVLLFSGGIDPVTPTRHGEAVAKALGAKARHISIENAGHGLLAQGCVSEVVTRFIGEKENADSLKVDATCVRQIPRPLPWILPVSNIKSTKTKINANLNMGDKS